MNNPAIKQPEAPLAPAKPAIRQPIVGDDVYFFDLERPQREHGGMGQGPFTARVLQVHTGPLGAGETHQVAPILFCVLKVMTPGGDIMHQKIGHKSTIEETRQRKFWEWPPARTR